jgi:DNA polymerase (family 10)
MDKLGVRTVLEQIAAYLQLRGGNPFRVRAYRRAARAIASYPGNLAAAVASGALADVKGVGDATLQVVKELLDTGRSEMLETLQEQSSPGLVELLRIPGLGVAKVRLIHEQLDIDSLAELEEAARDGRLAALPRFGQRTAEKVLRGIALLRRTSDVRLIHHALEESRIVQRALSQLGGVERVEAAGSVRRRREVIRDLDFVVRHARGARDALVRRLGDTPDVTEFAGKQGAVTLSFAGGTVADVYLAEPERFGLEWVRATGSPEHWEQLTALARQRGVPLDGVAYPEETDLYGALGLAWIPPELREGMGEIEAAGQDRLPKLVEPRDLRGLLHCHTSYSDGNTTVLEWAESCRQAGYEWIGITDHSQSAPYAGGLAAADVPRQHAEIDAVNRQLDNFRVLKGVEADILPDGSLDYGQPLLDSFDFVIASVHSRFTMSEREMTERVLTAMDDPHMTILGHPTGRLLLSREPFPIDLERVLEKAADRGIAVEVNADPHRQDLDWRMVRRARDRGVAVSIGADAHSISGMANVDIGLGIARKGWLEAAQVLNTRDAEGFLAHARRRRETWAAAR